MFLIIRLYSVSKDKILYVYSFAIQNNVSGTQIYITLLQTQIYVNLSVLISSILFHIYFSIFLIYTHIFLSYFSISVAHICNTAPHNTA